MIFKLKGESYEKSNQCSRSYYFSDNKILCAQRSEEMSLPLMWEFPGGKIEKNETEKKL